MRRWGRRILVARGNIRGGVYVLRTRYSVMPRNWLGKAPRESKRERGQVMNPKSCHHHLDAKKSRR
ncbi:hypothetical protein CPSG_07367 [Coccidioides posadasii str. Silveira]|uniref:Uncharacterized protein n=1 Tax=Coccidioides posadasii (strain RMSCC 757 / Silveira) TaxID=443226 RepID=E9DC15_COCPS|nr:hypothetical protein CPSG_07367 [Coccidioides posadasii str. Silveira]